MRAVALAALLLFVPSASAALPPGCTFLPGAYACAFEEQDDCGGFTTIGAGLNGVAGAAVAGIDGCDSSTIIATASVGATFVNLVWVDDAAGCRMVLATSTTATPLDCAAGAPPDAGWGDLLP